MIVLGLAALAALSIAISRKSQPENVTERLAAAMVFALTIGIQGLHFTEEVATGFHERFGPLFGLPAMPLSLFMGFNLPWLALWIVSVPGLRSARTPAFFVAWFLSIAGMLNGIAHPLLAIAAGGYFPGLFSSPFIGGAGVWLWLRLRRATTNLNKPGTDSEESVPNI